MSDLYSPLMDHLMFLLWICGIPVHCRYVEYLLQVQHTQALHEDIEKEKITKPSLTEQISQESSAKYEVLSVDSFPSSQDTAFPAVANMVECEIEEENNSIIEKCTQTSPHLLSFSSNSFLAASTKWPTFNDTERERKAYFKGVAQCLLHQVGKRCAQYSAALQACRGTEESIEKNTNSFSGGTTDSTTCSTSSSSPLQGNSTKQVILPRCPFDISYKWCSFGVSEVVALSVQQSSLCHQRRTSKGGEHTEVEKKKTREESNMYGGGDALVWEVHRLPLSMSASLQGGKINGSAGHQEFDGCCENPSGIVSYSASQSPVFIEVLALYTPETGMEDSIVEKRNAQIKWGSTPQHENRDVWAEREEEKKKKENGRSASDAMEEIGEKEMDIISASHPVSSSAATSTSPFPVMCSRPSKDSLSLPSMLWRRRACETALQLLYHAEAALESSFPISSTNGNLHSFLRADEVASDEKEKLGSCKRLSSVGTQFVDHRQHPFFFTRFSPFVTASFQNLVSVDPGGPTLLPLPSALPEEKRECRKTKRKSAAEILLPEKELEEDKKRRRLCGVLNPELPHPFAFLSPQTRLPSSSSSCTPPFVVVDDIEDEGSTDEKFSSVFLGSPALQAAGTQKDSEFLLVEANRNHTASSGMLHGVAAAGQPLLPQLKSQKRKASVSEKKCWTSPSLSSCSLTTTLEKEEATAHNHDFRSPSSAPEEGRYFPFSHCCTPPHEEEAQSPQNQKNIDVFSFSCSRSFVSAHGNNSATLFSPSPSTAISSSTSSEKDPLVVLVSDTDEEEDNQRC